MSNTTQNFTPIKRKKFLNMLAETANVSAAARHIGMSRRRMYQIKDTDPSFAEDWENAIDEGVDSLELEARRRAKDGTSKPLMYQGEKCGEVIEYSDTLMMFLLRAHRPEKYKYPEKLRVQNPVNQSVMLVPEVMDIDDWERASKEYAELSIESARIDSKR
ncbi:MAG: terminase [Pseudomonadota bacterium]